MSGIKFSEEDIKRPTNEIINQCIREFDRSENLSETVVKSAFENFDNNSEANILIKVIVLNSRYCTRLYDSNSKPSMNESVENIAKFILNNNYIFSKDDISQQDVVIWIDNARQALSNSEKNVPYSFLTKYCSWYFPTLNIPIVDSCSKAMLYYINRLYPYYIPVDNMKLTQDNISQGKYAFYCSIYEQFAEKYAKKYTYKQIDKYLWYYANNCANRIIRFD